MLVNNAGAQSKMVGKQLAQFAAMVIVPAIEALDEIIGSMP